MRFETRLAKAEQALGGHPDPGATARAFLQTLNDAELAALDRVMTAQEAGEALPPLAAAQLADYQRRWAALCAQGAVAKA
jgi:hypothetical protein